MPLVSVIIPAYRSETFIEETIRSVLGQSIDDLEIIVVDDGSPDRQVEIIKELGKEDDRIRLLCQSNQGVSRARNYGIENATGAFLAFLDADDVWLSSNLQCKLDKLSSGNFGLVHSDAVLIDENSNSLGRAMTGLEGDLLDNLLAWGQTCIPGPSSILVKAEVIAKVGRFDPDLSTSADQDFFFRVARHFKIGRVAEITWQYRIHSNNMSNNVQAMEQDVLRVFELAKERKYFNNKSFERACFANMYLILAASWAGDGKNCFRGIKFGLRALAKSPTYCTRAILRRCLDSYFKSDFK